MGHPQAYPSLFLPLFSVSELPCQGHMPSNKYNFGCWKKNRIQHKADGGKRQSAFGQPDQGTQALFQSPPSLERSESLNCQLLSTKAEPLFFYQPWQPHISSHNEFSDPLTFSWFLSASIILCRTRPSLHVLIHNLEPQNIVPPC